MNIEDYNRVIRSGNSGDEIMYNNRNVLTVKELEDKVISRIIEGIIYHLVSPFLR